MRTMRILVGELLHHCLYLSEPEKIALKHVRRLTEIFWKRARSGCGLLGLIWDF